MNTFDDINQIRRDNVRALIEQKEVSDAEFARMLGILPATLSNYTCHARNFGDALVRRMEVFFELPENWLDFPHANALAASPEERKHIENLRTLAAPACREVFAHAKRLLAESGPRYGTEELALLEVFRRLRPKDKADAMRMVERAPKAGPAVLPEFTGPYTSDEVLLLARYRSATEVGKIAIDGAMRAYLRFYAPPP